MGDLTNRTDWPRRFDFAGFETRDAEGEADLVYAFDGGPDFRETIAFNAPLPDSFWLGEEEAPEDTCK